MPLLSRRRLLGALTMFAGLWKTATAVASPAAGAPAVIERFYNDLLAVMRQAKRLTFQQRYDQLAPAISRTFDLPLMARIAVGPGWAQIAAEQQQRLSAAFARYTISVYANRFDDYSGERFDVTPTAVPNPNGVIVDSRLVKADGGTVALNYLLRQVGDGSWKVIDVYLSGTVSELATRRSEFAAVLQRSGADGLVQMIEQRTAALRSG